MTLKRSWIQVFLMVALTLVCTVSISLASSTLALAQDGGTGNDQNSEVNARAQNADDKKDDASGSQYDQYGQDIEITNIINIPGKDLPKTGGPPLLGILFAVVAGAGLLTTVVRRRQ